eukprot:1413872-Rhodomonas_salina.1
MEHLSASLSGCHNLQGTCRPVTNPLAPDGMPLSGVPCSIEEPCEDTCEFVGDIGRASVASSSFEEVGVDGASRNKHGSEHAVLVLAYSVLKRDLVVAIMTFRCGSPPRGVSLPHTTPNDFERSGAKLSVGDRDKISRASYTTLPSSLCPANEDQSSTNSSSRLYSGPCTPVQSWYSIFGPPYKEDDI